MSEDFGWGGDESFLEPFQFGLELNDMWAQQHQDDMRRLREEEMEEELQDDPCECCDECHWLLACFPDEYGKEE